MQILSSLSCFIKWLRWESRLRWESSWHLSALNALPHMGVRQPSPRPPLNMELLQYLTVTTYIFIYIQTSFLLCGLLNAIHCDIKPLSCFSFHLMYQLLNSIVLRLMEAYPFQLKYLQHFSNKISTLVIILKFNLMTCRAKSTLFEYTTFLCLLICDYFTLWLQFATQIRDYQSETKNHKISFSQSRLSRRFSNITITAI